MKPLTTALFSLLILGNSTSAINQNTGQKDNIPQKAITANTGIHDESLQTPLTIRSGIEKTALEGKTDILYSVMGSNIGRNSMHALDIDKDGNTEVICAASTPTSGSNNYWYILRQDTLTHSWNQIWTSTQHSNAINTLEILDYDQDGNFEILLGLNNGKIEIYNAETRELTRSVVAVPESINSMILADADNDSQTDLIISCPGNTYVLDPNTFVQNYKIPRGADYVRVGKLDNCGKNQVVLSSGSVYMLDNAETTNVWDFNTSGGAFIELADVDSDPYQEVVLARQKNTIYIYDVETRTTTDSIQTGQEINALMTSDANNDGKEDILYGDGQQGFIHCYHPATKTELWKISNPETGLCAMNYADVNDDGKKELVWTVGRTSSDPDCMYIYNVAEKSLIWKSDDIIGPFGALATGDVDNDGKDEIVAVSYESRSANDKSGILFIFDAQTNRLKWKSSSTFLSKVWEGLFNVTISDIDNNGINEIILAADEKYTGKIWVINGITHTIKSSHLFSSEALSNLHALEVADVDDDSQKELIVTTTSKLYVIDPSDWTVKWSAGISQAYTTPNIRCADINGDEAREIILCKGGIQVFNNIGQVKWTSPESNYTNIDILDFNNDKIQDIIASTSNGHLVVFEGKTKAILSNLNPENSRISSVRVFKSANIPFYIYSSNGTINVYENDQNCSTSKYLGMDAGAGESLKLFTSGNSKTDILVGSTTSIWRIPLDILSVSADTLKLTAARYSQATFDITTTKKWTIARNQEWLSTNKISATGNATITVTAQANDSTGKRSATLIVSAPGNTPQVITVVQEGAIPILKLSSDAKTLDFWTNSNDSVLITSNTNWETSCEADWLSLNATEGKGNSVLRLTAKANPTTIQRKATVYIVGAGDTLTLSVIQKASPAKLTLSTDTLYFSATSKELKHVTVNSNVAWTGSCEQPWLTLHTKSGIGENQLTVSVEENPRGTTRTASILFAGDGLTGKILVIKQYGATPVLNVSSSVLTISEENKDTTLTITSNTDWTVTCNQNWLSVSETSGSGDASLTLSASPNATGVVRAATLTVSGVGVAPKTLSVLQKSSAETDKLIFLYPINSSDEITIRNTSRNATINIYDSLGKLILTRVTTSTSEKIDLSTLNKGVYFIKYLDNDQTRTLMSKIIKR